MQQVSCVTLSSKSKIWVLLGWLGTVVGLYDNAAEVVWDQETAGASTLCNR